MGIVKNANGFSNRSALTNGTCRIAEAESGNLDSGQVRSAFQSTAEFNLARNIPSRAPVKAIVDETIERHGSEVYAKQHELLDTLGREVYSEQTQT